MRDFLNALFYFLLYFTLFRVFVVVASFGSKSGSRPEMRGGLLLAHSGETHRTRAIILVCLYEPREGHGVACRYGVYNVWLA